MPQFMLVLGGGRERSPAAQKMSHDEVMALYSNWNDKLRAKKQLVDSHKLEDGTGRRLICQAGRVTDGPFVESKESIGGYYVIEAKDLKEAVAIALECPTITTLKNGFCDVRPIEI